MGATTESIVAHGLAPIASAFCKARGETAPDELQRLERVATIANASAPLLLERIRSSCEGPLLLFKGPEVAHLYPGSARGFGDIDLLTPRAEEVHRALCAAGFVEIRSEAPSGHHHLTALAWPSLPLSVEVHSRLNWPKELPALGSSALFESGVPAAAAGFTAPDALHHTLILAVHGWQHHPLRVLRDLVDVAAMSVTLDQTELRSQASRLGISRLWGTTERAADALFYGGARSLSLRTWARSLEQVRQRSMLEIDLEAMISGFWWMKPRVAAATAFSLAHRRLLARPDETARGRALAALAWLRDANKPPR
ncbi:MAG TPA: nucleotidyltransferase family protein [Gaiellaceae bacterium]|nr:nucleotidyltransferase family protein [Gaiellaceae bacterium]